MTSITTLTDESPDELLCRMAVSPAAELMTFSELKEVIHRTKQGFKVLEGKRRELKIAQGLALEEIRARKLWDVPGGFSSFEEFCQTFAGMDRPAVSRRIQFAQKAIALSIDNEGQLKELARLNAHTDVEARVVREARRTGGGQLTAAVLHEAVSRELRRVKGWTYVHPDTLKPHPLRYVLGPITELKASLATFNMVNPIAVGPDGTILSGNRRWDAVRDLGWELVPIINVDVHTELDALGFMLSEQRAAEAVDHMWNMEEQFQREVAERAEAEEAIRVFTERFGRHFVEMCAFGGPEMPAV